MTVRLTYIFTDYPACEYIIILNTLIVIYDVFCLSVLLGSIPSMPIYVNRHPHKACLLTNARIIHAHVYHQFDSRVAEFYKKGKCTHRQTNMPRGKP